MSLYIDGWSKHKSLYFVAIVLHVEQPCLGTQFSLRVSFRKRVFGGSEVILHVAPALAVLGIVKPVLGLQTYSITKGISHYMYNDNTLKLLPS